MLVFRPQLGVKSPLLAEDLGWEDVMSGNRLIAALVTIILFIPPLFAVSGTIEGTVKDEDGVPLVGAVVSLFATVAPARVFTAESDAAGRFKIPGLEAGEYWLRASRRGFQPAPRSKVKVRPGKSVVLDLMLQALGPTESNDPRNWDLQTVLRTAPDRRLIFRELPGSVALETVSSDPEQGSFELTSAVGGEMFPSMAANLAYVRPLGESMRMVVAGQFGAGGDLWKIKNTLNYRLDQGQSVNLSLSYGKAGSLLQIAERAPNREVENLSLSLESVKRLFDLLTIVYGFEYDILKLDRKLSFLAPELQLFVVPDEKTLVKAIFTARRNSRYNTVSLPSGELVSLDNQVYYVLREQARAAAPYHYEFSLVRRLPDSSSLEISIYADKMRGGAPLLAFIDSEHKASRQVFWLEPEQASSQGLKLVYNRRLCSFLSGSVAYLYASSAGFIEADNYAADLSRMQINELIGKENFHAVTAQLDFVLNSTGTSLTTLVKLIPGHDPVATLDFFSDSRDVANGGFNLFIRQNIPLPSFLNLSAGRWEALLDMRNLLDQETKLFMTRSGQILIAKNPRSFRGGVAFKF